MSQNSPAHTPACAASADGTDEYTHAFTAAAAARK
jgi:hypothetical protein